MPELFKDEKIEAVHELIWRRSDLISKIRKLDNVKFVEQNKEIVDEFGFDINDETLKFHECHVFGVYIGVEQSSDVITFIKNKLFSELGDVNKELHELLKE